ncbi:UDP-N-acetylmuramoyl-L-alanyl-D-glutamate--2,6-diaminopimelate ligase [Candidatus Omnitrophota bacterium]
MNVKELFPDIPIAIAARFPKVAIQGVSCDSRSIAKDHIFVAVKGNQLDGNRYIPQAIKRGARVIVRESKKGKRAFALSNSILFCDVPDPRKTIAHLAAQLNGFPSRKLKTVGITGTNGKTTVSYLIEAILQYAGFKTGLIGTINYRFGSKRRQSTNTTPGPEQVQAMLAAMVKKKTKYCLMEVSSHALDQQRVSDIDFHAGIFTNLTRDHLDYHKTMDGYFSAKVKLFKSLNKKSWAVINHDDSFAQRLIRRTSARVVTFGLSKATVKADNIVVGRTGTSFDLITSNKRMQMQTRLIGHHNVYNILAAVSFCLIEGVDSDIIRDTVRRFKGAPGRLEAINCGQPFMVFVDYAHTDDALKNVLQSLRALPRKRIIVVFGCGGDRDTTKRPKMGSVATRLADFAIITNDNPRSEKPETIIKDIKKGITKTNYRVIYDREAAIKRALSMAQNDDIVLVAGKGHENYQVLKSQSIPFDDRKVARRIIRCLA